MLWKYRSEHSPPPPPGIDDWGGQLEISPLLARYLWQRGLCSLDEMQAFLNPSLQNLAPLDAWPGLRAAARVLAQGLLAGKTLCVWGDYDVDGITATSLVLDFLRQHGFTARYHIPDRLSEGYGLNAQGVERLAAQGVSMLLTVDCGISDLDAVEHAKSLGMTVIISDHHLPAEQLPPADALVNPRVGECPCPSLAGVGVAFLLMAAVNAELHAHGRNRVDIRPLLDLVALGTLADVVDLNGQNRILVKNGLLVIAEGKRPGLAALKSACNYPPNAALGAGQVVFTLAPRINAAGRLGSSDTAVELLLCKDRPEAADLAEQLSRLNARRREEESRILQQAVEQAQEQADRGALGLVVHDPGWHPGVIGIVASRLVEQFHRPTVVLSGDGDSLKGSGRSVRGFHMHEAFTQCADMFSAYGGHKMAAGLSLPADRLPEFKTRFDALAAQALAGGPVADECRIDMDLSFAQADFQLLKELEMLQPFGMGNAEPVFASPPVKVKTIRPRPGFLLLELEDEQACRCLTAKAWRDLAAMPAHMKGRHIRIAYTPRIDRYNGAATVELRIKDWQAV